MSNLVKILFIALFIGQSVFSWAQKDTTILFQNSQPLGLKEVSKIDKSLYGMYKDTANDTWLQISMRGFYKTATMFMQMPKTEVDENDQYWVKEGWIYGITKSDSLPCELENDTYYFGIPRKSELFSFNGEYSLKQLDAQTYILNTKLYADSSYQISKIYIENNTVELYSFDQFTFALKNDSLGVNYFDASETLVLKSLIIKDPEFFNYPGVQKYFKLENVFVRTEEE